MRAASPQPASPPSGLLVGRGDPRWCADPAGETLGSFQAPVTNPRRRGCMFLKPVSKPQFPRSSRVVAGCPPPGDGYKDPTTVPKARQRPRSCGAGQSLPAPVPGLSPDSGSLNPSTPDRLSVCLARVLTLPTWDLALLALHPAAPHPLGRSVPTHCRVRALQGPRARAPVPSSPPRNPNPKSPSGTSDPAFCPAQPPDLSSLPWRPSNPEFFPLRTPPTPSSPLRIPGSIPGSPPRDPAPTEFSTGNLQSLLLPPHNTLPQVLRRGDLPIPSSFPTHPDPELSITHP